MVHENNKSYFYELYKFNSAFVSFPLSGARLVFCPCRTVVFSGSFLDAGSLFALVPFHRARSVKQ